MPILLGMIVGRAFGLLLGRVVFSHAALTLGVWIGVSAGAYWLAEQNAGHSAAVGAGVTAPAALLAWTLRRPAESRIKLWLFDGFYVWTRLGIACVVVASALALVADHGVLRSWLADVWRTALVGLALLALQRCLLVWLRRSHLRAGDASCLGG